MLVGSEDSRYLECEDNSELGTCLEVLEKTLDTARSHEEVKLLEDIYQMNASQAFERYNAIALGIPGLRLDLFYPEYSQKESEDRNTEVT